MRPRPGPATTTPTVWEPVIHQINGPLALHHLHVCEPASHKALRNPSPQAIGKTSHIGSTTNSSSPSSMNHVISSLGGRALSPGKAAAALPVSLAGRSPLFSSPSSFSYSRSLMVSFGR